MIFKIITLFLAFIIVITMIGTALKKRKCKTCGKYKVICHCEA